MGKKFSGVSQTMSRFRGWIQAGATLLTNLHLPNFLKGGLYQGTGKTVCVPGLNCYSCPAASGACPIGAFQAVVGSSKFSFSYYITGFLILLGVLLGRFICGFLCPFGWFQELLHKIPTKKLSTKRLTPCYCCLSIAFPLLLPYLYRLRSRSGSTRLSSDRRGCTFRSGCTRYGWAFSSHPHPSCRLWRISRRRRTYSYPHREE